MTAFERHVAGAAVMEWPILGARGWRHEHGYGGQVAPRPHDHLRGDVDLDPHPIEEAAEG